MSAVESLGPLVGGDGPMGALYDAECMDGTFQETAYTHEQVEKANAAEKMQLPQAQCQFLSDAP